jgi:transcription initiation factor TFIIB
MMKQEAYQDNQGKCCAQPALILDFAHGSYVCQNCGVVADRIYVNFEPRAFGADDVERRVHAEVVGRDFGPRTMLGCATDFRGAIPDAQTNRYFKRLAKIQGSMITSAERNLWEAKPRIKAFASRLNLPDAPAGFAWRVYRKTVALKLTAGRTLNGMLGACLFLAINKFEVPLHQGEVLKVCGLTEKTLMGYVSLLVQKVYPVLGLRYQTSPLRAIIQRFITELGLDEWVTLEVLRLYARAKRCGFNTSGLRKNGIVAALVYMVSETHQLKLSQAKIAGVGRVTTVTLRSRVTTMKALLDR